MQKEAYSEINLKTKNDEVDFKYGTIFKFFLIINEFFCLCIPKSVRVRELVTGMNTTHSPLLCLYSAQNQ